MKAPDCDDPFDSLIPVDEARRRLLDALPAAVAEVDSLALEEASGRVLARPVSAGFDVPALANSAMDGYALAATSIPADGSVTLPVAGTAWAGTPFSGSLPDGCAVRIFTGAVMPAGADTVVMQERAGADTVEGAAVVTIDADVEALRNVRLAGEDVAAGETVFDAGRRLGAADIGVLASLGIAQVTVHRRLRVAVFTTGDELVPLGEADLTQGVASVPGPGLLYDSNRFTLRALLARLDVELIDLGIVADTLQATRDAFARASSQADLVISSGGISTGDADHVRTVFHELGDVAFWRLAMRPGRPLAVGRIGKATFFGLPGNPVAVMVTFLQFVQPALRLLAGETPTPVLTLPARALSRLRKSLGRTEFLRGVAGLDAEGILVVDTTGPQGAGRLSSMAAANCLIVIAPHVARVEPGDMVGVQLLDGLLP